MHKPIIVTYWWGSGVCKNTCRNYLTNNMCASPMTYPDMVRRLEQRSKCAGFDFYAEELESIKGYQNAISYKPTFILKMLKKWKRPVIYLDCDMLIHKPPLIFTTNKYDFMAFNWNGDARVTNQKSVLFDWHVLETSGGVFYFNNTLPARQLLLGWETRLKQNPKMADDRILAMVFKEFTDKSPNRLRYYWIPMEYFYVPQYYRGTIPHHTVVISHPFGLTDENEALALSGTRDRVPKGYDKKVAKVAKHHSHVLEINRNCTIIHEIQGRNKGLKKANITYKLVSENATEIPKYFQIIS